MQPDCRQLGNWCFRVSNLKVADTDRKISFFSNISYNFSFLCKCSKHYNIYIYDWFFFKPTWFNVLNDFLFANVHPKPPPPVLPTPPVHSVHHVWSSSSLFHATLPAFPLRSNPAACAMWFLHSVLSLRSNPAAMCFFTLWPFSGVKPCYHSVFT